MRVPVDVAAALRFLKFEQPRDVQPRIDRRIAIRTHLEMAVRSRGVARRSRLCDELSLLHRLTDADDDAAVVSVERCEIAAVVNHDSVAVAVEPSCHRHRSRRCGDDIVALVRIKIDARMIAFLA